MSGWQSLRVRVCNPYACRSEADQRENCFFFSLQMTNKNGMGRTRVVGVFDKKRVHVDKGVSVRVIFSKIFIRMVELNQIILTKVKIYFEGGQKGFYFCIFIVFSRKIINFNLVYFLAFEKFCYFSFQGLFQYCSLQRPRILFLTIAREL